MSFLTIKGALARLMATENLVVEHDPKAVTAAFNTETRVLSLPEINTNSEYVYNLFIGHEVGHALYTPQTWSDGVKSPQLSTILNIVEDVRIEKKIQYKFPGLKVDFNRGYNELNDKDFFQIEDKNLDEMCFLDRVNIHYKLGALQYIQFSEDEMEYVDAISQCETYDDVIEVSNRILEYLKSEKTETSEIQNASLDDQQEGGSGNSVETESTESKGSDNQSSYANDGTPSSESEEDCSSPEDNNKSSGGSSESNQPDTDSPQVDEFDVTTQEAFDQALRKMARTYGSAITYITEKHISEKELDELVIPISNFRDSYPSLEGLPHPFEKEFQEFLRKSIGEVNLMVQRFEQKKSADAYARASVHKTGVLNTQKLHNYKLSDDIFLRQTTIPNGKNHGMVFFLDWSGSMDKIAFATIKQLIVLIQFCRKVRIPFEVYTFTTQHNRRCDITKKILDSQNNQISFDSVHVINVLNSDSTKSQIDKDMLNIFTEGRLSYPHTQDHRAKPKSSILQYGGTPLDTALFLVEPIIHRFEKKHKVQKISFVCLTDGDSSPLQVYYKNNYGMRTEHVHNLGGRVMIRSRNGETFELTYHNDKTGTIARFIQNKLPNVVFSNIFLGQSKEVSRYLTLFGIPYDSKSFKNNGCASALSKTYWPMICAINPGNFCDFSDEIEVNDGADKKQIHSALKKLLNKRNSAKQVLVQLVEQFC